jgi:hypothetical protein
MDESVLLSWKNLHEYTADQFKCDNIGRLAISSILRYENNKTEGFEQLDFDRGALNALAGLLYVLPQTSIAEINLFVTGFKAEAKILDRTVIEGTIRLIWMLGIPSERRDRVWRYYNEFLPALISVDAPKAQKNVDLNKSAGMKIFSPEAWRTDFIGKYRSEIKKFDKTKRDEILRKWKINEQFDAIEMSKVIPVNLVRLIRYDYSNFSHLVHADPVGVQMAEVSRPLIADSMQQIAMAIFLSRLRKSLVKWMCSIGSSFQLLTKSPEEELFDKILLQVTAVRSASEAKSRGDSADKVLSNFRKYLHTHAGEKRGEWFNVD